MHRLSAIANHFPSSCSQQQPSLHPSSTASLQGPNKAAVLLRKDELVLKDIALPTAPGPNEVIVEMKAVGICGSDVHYWTHGAIGDFIVRQPMVIGHESAGQVVQVGANVTHVRPGDKVALEPGVPCRKCQHCKGGQYNLCADVQFFATPPVDGSMAKYVKHSADFCHKLPPNLSYEDGAMCEPLSVGVFSCQRAHVQPGDSVLITGAGPIGIICMWVAKAFGARNVFLTDVSDQRLQDAKKFGATAVFNARTSTEPLTAEVIRANGGTHVDCAIECCGFESASRLAINCTKSGGTVCMVGMGQAEMKLPAFQIGVRQVDIRGIFRYSNTYPTCIKLLSSGAVDVKPLITHRYKLDDLVEAFTVAKEGRDGALKVMFTL